jgi:hypothetical protein
MAIATHPSVIATVGIAALIAWRVYRRVRRSIGRQRLSPVRPWLTVTLFPLLVAMLLLGSLFHPTSALSLVGGIGVGATLGIYGLRLTKFEPTPEGLFYTPNAHLGIALSLLLIARIGYRAIQMYAADLPMDTPPTDFVRSPLTLVIFGTLAGYYVTYAIGLLRWQARVRSTVAPPIAQPPDSGG